jgi:hypothetical protein
MGRGLLEGNDMKVAFIAKHQTVWLVARQCDTLGLSRSGFQLG